MKKYFWIPLILLIIFSSCTKNEMKKNIKKKEETFNAGLKKDTVLYALGRDLIVQYDSFIKRYPKDSRCPEMVFNAGAMYLKYLSDNWEAIKYFDLLYEKYPDYERTPEALFTIANLYNDFLKKQDKAKAYFELIIKTYPKHRLASDSKVLLRNIGKSDEELWNDIQKQQKEQSEKK